MIRGLTRHLARTLVLLAWCAAACKSSETSVGEPSVVDRVDQGHETDVEVTVLPFTDAEGRVYVVGPEGKLQLLEGVLAASSEDGPPPTPEAMARMVDLLSADVHVVGVLGAEDGKVVLAAHAVDPHTGDVFAEGKATFDNVTPPSDRPLPPGLPVTYAPLSPGALILAQERGGIRRQQVRVGPREGWGRVFIGTLGGAWRGSRSRPETYEPFDDDDPRDEPPPEIFGEEIDEPAVCRVKLQCRWAMANQFYSLSPGFVSQNYHCGWYSLISTAAVPRLGTHVQSAAPQIGQLLTSHVEALIFNSDRGFQELSWAFKFEPFDSQRDGSQDSCEMAKCLREQSWAYRLRDDRPHEAFGQRKPNSNSYIGAMRNSCVAGIDPPPPFNNEGQYAGVHYWQRVNRDWRSHRW